MNPSDILVKIQKVEEGQEAEIDEMWSYVGSKENQRWLWHAIDHHSGKVLAYVFGNHEDAVGSVLDVDMKLYKALIVLILIG